MKNFVLKIAFRLVMITFFFILAASCSAPKDKYQKAYNIVWKEMIKSEAWKNSLVTSAVKTDTESTDFYSSTGDVVLTKTATKDALILEEDFPDKYNDLVSRAYFKIIAQAENANDQLKKEYDLWNSQRQEEMIKNDKTYKKNQEQINKKYAAHQAMLEGLKSWNIFSENRSGDLEFFKAENEIETYTMLQYGESEERIVNLLVYKLADLYHFEQQ